MNSQLPTVILWGLLAGSLLLSPAAAQSTTRVSVDSTGGQGANQSYDSSVSADGRYVAFDSYASNLVSGDTNNAWDIFVHDRQTGQTTRVSVDSAGVQGNNSSYAPSVSADGRYVAFRSDATNLVLGDTNGTGDIFVHDRLTVQTSLASVDSAGTQGNSSSDFASISANGRHVAFQSYASNLVTGDTNGVPDIFVHDRQMGMTSRVSVDSAAGQGNDASSYCAISADGGSITFYSHADNLVPGDTNGAIDIFVHDRQTGQTSRVSVNSAGVQGNAQSDISSISADGRYVAFQSYANNLVSGDTNNSLDIFVHDRQTGQTSRVSVDSAGVQGNRQSEFPSVAADGSSVAFQSWATNLVSGDTNNVVDVFVHDRQTVQTSRVSVSTAGSQGNGTSLNPSISADGRFVAFDSWATNLVSGDTNNVVDVFVHDREPGLTLASSGTCPGPMTFTASDATPGATVAFIWGTSGSFTIPAGRPCAGTQLDLAPLLTPPPGYLLATANGSGTASTAGTVPPTACGVVLMQAVDLTTCGTSNTVSL